MRQATAGRSPVYPRACGGTPRSVCGTRVGLGLSPRLRGNPGISSLNPHWAGSIPAPAGEPWAGPAPTQASGVYPRACGGTCHQQSPFQDQTGLSPRLRGNHDVQREKHEYVRSIPAPAGEPRPVAWPRGLDQVYPRACGGTQITVGSTTSLDGLSPRLRGNPPRTSGSTASGWSIPAPAGEPATVGAPLEMLAVYPRACGGTGSDGCPTYQLAGLSPRLRGNQWRYLSWFRPVRSIPAPAGEPVTVDRVQVNSGVYPRACGGTPIRYACAGQPHGLSPRLRGNRSSPV